MSDLNQTYKISPILSNNMIYVKDDFKYPVRNHPHPKVLNISFLIQIMSDLVQTFRIVPLATTNIIFNVQLDPIPQISSQE